jgi:Glycosyl transferase family 2
MNVPLTIIVPSCSRVERLHQALLSIEKCHLPPGYQGMIIVENGPHRFLGDLVQAFHSSLGAVYKHIPKACKSAALNHALSFVTPGLAVFFDDDITVGDRTLVGYSEAAKIYGRGHFFGGPTGIDCENPPPDWLLNMLPHSAKGIDRGNVIVVSKNSHFLGHNWAAWTEDIFDLGGFNENFGPGSWTLSTGQETEMQLRMMSQNYRSVYLPECRVIHYVPTYDYKRWLLARHFRMGVQRALLSRASLFARSTLRTGVTMIAALGRILFFGVTRKRVLFFDAATTVVSILGFWWGTLCNTWAFWRRRSLVDKLSVSVGEW